MRGQRRGPRPGGAGATLNDHHAHKRTLFDGGRQEGNGDLAKLRALELLRARNPDRVRAAQRAMLRVVLEDGSCTVDDVRAALELPDSEPARWLGAVPGELRRAGLIRRAGYAETRRVVAHARPVSIWEIADAEAARAWLSRLPEHSATRPSPAETLWG